MRLESHSTAGISITQITVVQNYVLTFSRLKLLDVVPVIFNFTNEFLVQK